MSALVVVETYFGNTRQIGEVVAHHLKSAGIHTIVVAVEEAPTQLDPDVELLVVGAPTHNLGLSTPGSRRTASAQIGQPAPRIGVREWAGQVAQPSVPVLAALFDTRTGHPWMVGSAAAQASVLFARNGFAVMAARETFLGQRNHRAPRAGGRRARTPLDPRCSRPPERPPALRTCLPVHKSNALAHHVG